MDIPNCDPAIASQVVPAAIGVEEYWARGVATAIFAAAALITLQGVHAMGGGMLMPGGWTMPMMWMVMPGQTLWRAAWMFLLMWQAMMIAMMLPSSWPMFELYQRVARSSGQRHRWLGITLLGTAYFGVWLLFGIAALGLGFSISGAAMSSARWSRIVPVVSGAGLILAGVFQLSPFKQVYLRHCRSPLTCLGHAWRPGLLGAIRIGVYHGAFCAACCWALMLLQMILGVMNLEVMILIAAVIGFEKLWRRGPLLARFAGGAAIALEFFILANAVAGVRAV